MTSKICVCLGNTSHKGNDKKGEREKVREGGRKDLMKTNTQAQRGPREAVGSVCAHPVVVTC